MPGWWADCTSPKSVSAASPAALRTPPGASAPSGHQMATSHQVTVKCSYKLRAIPLTFPSDSCFGDVKAAASKEIGIDPEYLKLLFRGREKADGDAIYSAGVKDGAKLLLVETEEYKKVHGAELAVQGALPEPPPVTAAAVEEDAATEGGAAAPGLSGEDAALMARIDTISAEVEEMGSQVQELLDARAGGDDAAPGGSECMSPAEPKKVKMLTELLTQKLLALDNLDVAGKTEVRQRRKEVINRTNQLCDKLEELKPRL